MGELNEHDDDVDDDGGVIFLRAVLARPRLIGEGNKVVPVVVCCRVEEDDGIGDIVGHCAPITDSDCESSDRVVVIERGGRCDCGASILRDE